MTHFVVVAGKWDNDSHKRIYKYISPPIYDFDEACREWENLTGYPFRHIEIYGTNLKYGALLFDYERD